MLDDTGVKVFPSFFGTENRRLPEEFAINCFYSWPSHELPRDETLDKVTGNDIMYS